MEIVVIGQSIYRTLHKPLVSIFFPCHLQCCILYFGGGDNDILIFPQSMFVHWATEKDIYSQQAP